MFGSKFTYRRIPIWPPRLGSLNKTLVGRLRKLLFKILSLGTKGRLTELAHFHNIMHIMTEIAKLSSVQYGVYKKCGPAAKSKMRPG